MCCIASEGVRSCESHMIYGGEKRETRAKLWPSWAKDKCIAQQTVQCTQHCVLSCGSLRWGSTVESADLQEDSREVIQHRLQQLQTERARHLRHAHQPVRSVSVHQLTQILFEGKTREDERVQNVYCMWSKVFLQYKKNIVVERHWNLQQTPSQPLTATPESRCKITQGCFPILAFKYPWPEYT